MLSPGRLLSCLASLFDRYPANKQGARAHARAGRQPAAGQGRRVSGGFATGSRDVVVRRQLAPHELVVARGGGVKRAAASSRPTRPAVRQPPSRRRYPRPGQPYLRSSAHPGNPPRRHLVRLAKTRFVRRRTSRPVRALRPAPPLGRVPLASPSPLADPPLALLSPFSYCLASPLHPVPSVLPGTVAVLEVGWTSDRTAGRELTTRRGTASTRSRPSTCPRPTHPTSGHDARATSASGLRAALLEPPNVH